MVSSVHETEKREEERLRETLTAKRSHSCKDSQQRIALHAVPSLKLQTAANCCKIVADLCTCQGEGPTIISQLDSV